MSGQHARIMLAGALTLAGAQFRVDAQIAKLPRAAPAYEMTAGELDASATEKLEKKKLQVFLMLGQSNMVGLADIRTFQYLLQEPYRPAFEEVKEALKSGVYYSHICSRYGWELGDRMRRDPQHTALHPRDLRRLIRRTILDTLPDDERVTDRDLYADMMSRLEARLPLRRKMSERFLEGTTEADFEQLGSLMKTVRNLPEVRDTPGALRLAHARAVEKAIHLPIARRTYIASYGAFQAPGNLGIRSEASGRLSIGWGSRYTSIGPEYGFGIALEEKFDAPILIIKCAWGNTALGGAWRPPSAPPRTETAEAKALREARNAALAAKARAEGKEFEPFPARHAPSPGWCWEEMKFQEHIQRVLADPGRFHPEYDEAVGYEVAGMIWFQGHSDFGYDSGREYKQTMGHFIRDLRDLVETPEMPVVIGTVSTDVFKARNDHSPVTRSQIAVAELPEFKGNVTTVRTLPFYPTELELLRSVMKQVQQADPEYRTSPRYARLARIRGISNGGYHYMGSAECFVEMGDAFASAMLALMKRSTTDGESAPGKTSDRPAPAKVELPGLVVDFRERCVDLEGTICLEEGLLELVACTRGTKEHESIVVIDAMPLHIHTALLLLGVNPGHPALRRPVDEQETRWIDVPPRGDPVEVYLVFEHLDGRRVERPIGDFVARSGERPDELRADENIEFPRTFLFAGSHLVAGGSGPRKYLSDLSGHVISIATFGDELLCLPGTHDHADGSLMWQVDSAGLPEIGTRVTLRLRPKPRSAVQAGTEGEGKN